MEPSSVFCTKILHLLALRSHRSCTLEELTSLTVLFSATVQPLTSLSQERQQQAVVLNALLLLSEKGCIFLSPFSDQSCITIKGLLAIHDKAICN